MDSVELDARTERVHNLIVAPQDAKRKYHDAMASLAGAVNIVTTMSDGRAVGFAATAVCSVTDEPPTLLVCVNRNGSTYEAFNNADRLCVNTLATDQEHVSRSFGGKTPQEERFASAEWTTLTTGSPALVGATVSFDCRIRSRTAAGTHDVMICEVECVRYSERRAGLVYFRRGYHEVG